MSNGQPLQRIKQENRNRAAEARAEQRRQDSIDREGLEKIGQVIGSINPDLFTKTLEILTPSVFRTKNRVIRQATKIGTFTLFQYSTGRDETKGSVYYTRESVPKRFRVASAVSGLVVPEVLLRRSSSHWDSTTNRVSIAVSSEGELWETPILSYGSEDIYGVEKRPFISGRNLNYKPEGCPPLSDIADMISDFSKGHHPQPENKGDITTASQEDIRRVAASQYYPEGTTPPGLK